jgi:pyruvate/2-oxoglutarate dehydrogenase complex dihydrolipoamide acyltransferase (E2) component
MDRKSTLKKDRERRRKEHQLRNVAALEEEQRLQRMSTQERVEYRARLRRERLERFRRSNVRGSEFEQRRVANAAPRNLNPKMGSASPENKMLAGPPENKGLDAVQFASPAARELADDAGLDENDFNGAQPTSSRGFTADDVRDIVGEIEE